MQDAVHGGLAVELCLRSSAPSVTRGRQQAVLDRVGDLAADVALDESTVTWWSTRVCTPESDAGPADRCPRIVGEILALGDTPGVSVEPYFRRCEATREGEPDVVFLPVICLLVRRDGDLCGLYPATVDGDRYTVQDGLARLERGGRVENLP